MSTSLSNFQTPAEIAKLATDLLQQPILKAEPIGRGANSRVYRLSSEASEYVIKFYFQHAQDKRDRLSTEFKSLSFLWKKGIRQIPEPLMMWPSQSCALYAMVNGNSALNQVGEDEVIQAAVFLEKLKVLSRSSDAQNFSAASEAFFCGKDIVGAIKNRLTRFSIEGNELNRALWEYLEKDFLPLLEAVEAWARGILKDQGVSWQEDLEGGYRTLSSSDFGFHNALCSAEGLIFLDFEYFGWDDPAKAVSDFILHPAMTLSEGQKHRFIKQVQGVYGEDPQFKNRLKAYFPLFGLKWCLIFLNEFVSTDMLRRGFAKGILEDTEVLCLKQLAKAKALNQQIKTMYKDFPYGN